MARYRAGDLLEGLPAPGRDGEYWLTSARMVLAALLHAAALGGATMTDVRAWLVGPDSAVDEVVRYLSRSPEPLMAQDAWEFFQLPHGGRSSTAKTALQALEWLADPCAAAAAQKGDLDVEQLLAQRATVYLLARKEAHTAPLLTALAAHIAREARRLASAQPEERLDPPLTLVLDEVGQICSPPLPDWTSDMGGSGITIHIGVQSRARLRQKWGDDGAAAVLNNAAAVVVYGGARDSADLSECSTLAPALSPAMVAQMPAWHVLVIRRGMPPVIGRVRPVWRRLDVRWARLAATVASLARRGTSTWAHMSGRRVQHADTPSGPQLRLVPGSDRPEPGRDVA